MNKLVQLLAIIFYTFSALALAQVDEFLEANPTINGVAAQDLEGWYWKELGLSDEGEPQIVGCVGNSTSEAENRCTCSVFAKKDGIWVLHNGFAFKSSEAGVAAAAEYGCGTVPSQP
ncbi:hypothetical protein [Microbulbifer sp. YPW1]|uniref:hypothetical protein n=1 Tax=Microbulbifer sp. YPW1 TaxID=2745199 RepID=UPI00159B3AC6|nr:hypothetical protein [Microbulbifer sp. YPW1]QKX17647.1 hypothetical protein HUW35_11990 [Microbulbifer sp. YPW1]